MGARHHLLRCVRVLQRRVLLPERTAPPGPRARVGNVRALVLLMAGDLPVELALPAAFTVVVYLMAGLNPSPTEDVVGEAGPGECAAMFVGYRLLAYLRRIRTC
jgi:hypothetical protein